MLSSGNFHYADGQHGNYFSADLTLLSTSYRGEKNTCYGSYIHIEGLEAIPDSGKYILFLSRLQE
jgi:hypothetical protein